MRAYNCPLMCLPGAIPAIVFGAVSLASTGAVAGDCTFAPPLTTQTRCLTAVSIPGNPLRSFDISFVNPDRAEFYFSDRSNSAIDIIDTETLKFKRFLGGFAGVALNNGNVDNNHSGPDGVTTHGRWLYAGDGNSTLKIFDLDAPPALALKRTISTGGTRSSRPRLIPRSCLQASGCRWNSRPGIARPGGSIRRFRSSKTTRRVAISTRMPERSPAAVVCL